MSQPDVLKVSILAKDSIHCGFHLIPYVAHTVLSSLPASTYVLITDSNVARFHLAPFVSAFEHAPRFLTLVITPGETSKSREGKAGIEDFLLANACTRDTVILALGGGVIGDLVGFVAATFMRGLRFCQIPTTLLAMVDSSVGGKTAIDTPHGKNLIGAFWQPEYIFIDLAFLETLPVREFSNGMAEVIKTAAIWNAEEFALLESRALDIYAAIRTPSQNFAGRTLATRSATQRLLLTVIRGSIAVKAHIVTVDERETGLRNLVNFGHTIGHAIEAVLTPTILHGECVAVGMILEAEIARGMGVLAQGAVGRLVRCCKAYDLPTSVSDPRIARLPAARTLTVRRLLDIMKVDKKNSGPEKKIVILSRIGATYEQKATVIRDDVIAKTLSDAVRVVNGTPKHDPVRMITPGSKSISNRALVLAALAKGTCRLKNLLTSDDTQVMMGALIDLKGASFEYEDGGETLVVHGGGGSLAVPPAGSEIYLGNAGTAARFLTTVCTLARSSPSSPPSTIITGNARMKQRPIGPLVDALVANGSAIACLESPGCLPLAIGPQGLKGGRIELGASVSSQYVSSVLLSAPYAECAVELHLVGGQVISQPYIDMTIAMMAAFGVAVTRRRGEDGTLLDVYDVPKAVYISPETYAIESDASSATYPLAVAAITGTTCTIENIGSGSLQGDARFALEVLGRMGCEVVQTERETTVKGPKVGSLSSIGEVDMEMMTDAFLTATVLVAVAGGTTRIRGIANQRVKECDRIRAMMDELAKFGVDTVELADGLEIHGKRVGELREGVRVRCYDDHRVAMAFSVLAVVVPGTVLEEKRCVEKTWPNWWDDLENKIGVEVEGIELASFGAPVSGGERDAERSVLVIGMRGSGKTHVGSLAAETLGRAFVDADAYFENTLNVGVREYVQQHGWEAFRSAENTVLRELLDKFGRGHVLSLGGGIVETDEGRDALKRHVQTGGLVVYVVREIGEIVDYLGSEGARPAYGESVEDVFRRREPWFRECSSHEFMNRTNDEGTSSEVARFFGHVTGQNVNGAVNLGKGRRSYFLSLTYPDIRAALPHIEELSAGVDALELRVDLLQSGNGNATEYRIPDLAYVTEQISILRRVTSLPIVYTVRTVSQGGAFPDTAEKEAFELFELGRRHGAEYIDVEISWTESKIRAFAARKGSSQIVASWHDWSGNMKWDGAEVRERYDMAHGIGDIVKIVGKASSIDDNFALQAFASRVNAVPGSKPFIAINMGVEGQLSRALNATLSPVSHPLQPNKAAPGQLSFAQIQNTLHLIGQLPARRFYLFGHPIAHSMSPTLHNAAFESLGLPHRYELLETEKVGDEIRAALTGSEFGGASVTIPHKLDVIPLLDKLSPAAEAIGAVNTIISCQEGQGKILYGDNTDWIGIRESIRSRRSGKLEAGLVIGAGGTARAAIYALRSLKAEKIYLYNRTRANAQALADASPDYPISIVDGLESWPEGAPSVIVSTVPATTSDADARNGGAYIPVSLLSRVEGSVVVDMAYKPAETPLLKQAKAAGWATVPGLEVLLEQGFEQLKLWTGRRCAKKAISKKVWEVYSASG